MALLTDSLALPVIGAPMFLVSGPELVIAQCCAGIVGTMPSLNVRDAEAFEPTLVRIRDALDAWDRLHPESPAAPFGINLVVRPERPRFLHDLSACVRQRVPLIITSLGSPSAVVEAVRPHGGLVFHDVTSLRHAHKAAEAGVDGIIAVASGAGGHGGTVSPFALCREIRSHYDGTLVLAGAISSGDDIAAAIAMDANMVSIGTRFIATEESAASEPYKAMVLGCTSADIVYTDRFSGVPGNYLIPSIHAAGLDPGSLEQDPFTTGGRAWRDIWSAGHSVGAATDIPTTAALVARMREEMNVAAARLHGYLARRSAVFA